MPSVKLGPITSGCGRSRFLLVSAPNLRRCFRFLVQAGLNLVTLFAHLSSFCRVAADPDCLVVSALNLRRCFRFLDHAG